MVYNKSTLYLILLLAAISAIIVGMIAGCDEKKINPPVLGPAAGSGPIGGGETQKIRLSASPSDMIIAVGDEQASAKITALVENNIGQPMPDGTAVYWNATVGSLDSTTQTTSNGSATVTLTFQKNYTGCSTVTAKSGDSQASIAICTTHVTPTPTVTATATPTTTTTPSEVFIVSASNTTIAHQGTSTITAYATTDGRPDVGLQVNFSVSSGGVLDPGAAVTDSTGNARVTFTGYNTSSGDITATITATTQDGRSGTVTVIVTSGATPTPSPTPSPTPTQTVAPTATPIQYFIVTANPQALSILTDCAAPPAQVTVNAYAETNGSADEGLQVDFSSSGGGTLSASGDITDNTGNASVTFTWDCTTTGTITFTALSEDGRSGAISILTTN